jgi:integrase/recombinase XerD
MLLSEAWPLYEADKRLLGYSEETFKAYKIQSGLLCRGMGDIDIKEVTFEGLKAYLAAQTHLAKSSLGHRVRFVRSLFRWANEEGYIPTNPAARLREPKLGKRIPRAIPEDIVVELQECCESPLERALLEFFYASGCRIGEVYGLNRNAINWQNRSAIILGKGDKEREIYFTDRCAVWLRKYFKSRTDTDMALFVTERRPIHRMSKAEMRYIINRIMGRLEEKSKISPHRLRHTYAMHLLNNGAPLFFIQSMLGHTKPSTTEIYLHLSGEYRRQEYKKHFN